MEMVFVAAVVGGVCYLTLTGYGAVTIARWWYGFRDNNNIRLLTAWAVAVSITIMYFLWCGGDPIIGAQDVMDAESQRVLNLFYAASGEGASSQPHRWFWSWMCRGLGWLVFCFWICAIVYTPIAVWDEIGRAYEFAARKVQEAGEQRQDIQDVIQQQIVLQGSPATAASVIPTRGHPTLAQIFTTQFISDFLNELWALIIGH